MPKLQYKNSFGSQGQSGANLLDLQRSDLFKVSLILPPAIGLTWIDNVEFAIETFPWPERSTQPIPVKFMQQTNFIVGPDTATPSIDLKVRYAFAQPTAQALEKWYWLTSNPLTGGVGLTSQVKAHGRMRYLVPNMAKQIADLNAQALPGQNTLMDGLVYELEGIMIKSFKYSDSSATEGTYVTIQMGLQIDRYYAVDPNSMVVAV